ncbi:unnamed protein product [Caenorhabditis angaria]|uniref:Actin-interacting protein 1 n=1 Tax=Caenorhabditis angaria TaxID=860376 RepID=A0A9P1J452_9PELO|nr:unnamed protein product [Caenorhabditis angaria]
MAEYQHVSTFPSLPKTNRGLPLVISSTPSGDKIVYCNGNSVYIVPSDNLTGTDIYTEHPVATTVAKYSPSGFYCASGDQNGNIRIWDTTQTTHILKATYPIFSGPVRDIAWNDDSKRLAVVGEGKERFGHVFLFDTGTSNGNLSGQSRAMSSVDFKPTRPYRIISGSEDNTVALFEGPPFKFKTTFHEHSRFVNVTRYNNDGSLFASAGADGKVVLFEGTEGTKVGELADDAAKGAAHGGSVFGLSWSPDGSKIATASGDKTVKIWNAADRSLLKTITFGTAIEDQQVSVQWSKQALVSVSLSGFVNFLNVELGTVETIRQGHNKPIVALALSQDKQHIFTSDFEGHTTRWELATGKSQRVKPTLHKSQIVGLAHASNGNLYSVGWDDTINVATIGADGVESAKVNPTKLPSQPLGLAAAKDGSVAVVACYQHIAVQSGGNISVTGIPYHGAAIALSPDNTIVAVGGQDSKVHIYKLSGSQLSAEIKTLNHSGAITALSFSPNGEYLAVTDSARKVVPYSVAKDYVSASDKEWTFHTAKVNCVSWSPNGKRLATGSLDTSIIVWNLEKSGEHPIIIKGAHAMSPVNGVVWINDTTIISAGQDANIKHWNVPL